MVLDQVAKQGQQSFLGISDRFFRSPEGERVAVEAIYMIEREAHMRGLTDRIREMIAKSPRMEEEVAKQAP